MAATGGASGAMAGHGVGSTVRDAGAAVRRMLPRRADYAGLRASWRTDLLAGLTVGVVALPLGVGVRDLDRAWCPGRSDHGDRGRSRGGRVRRVERAGFGTDRRDDGGAGSVVARYGADAIYVVGVMAGVLIVVAALARLGRLLAFIPWPVIEGFTVGIAAIIFLQQVPAALGVPKPEGENTAAVAVRALRRRVPQATARLLRWPSSCSLPP